MNGKFNRFFEQVAPISAPVPFSCYKPNYDSEQELYRIDNAPVNIVDNSQFNPVIQNIAQQQLQDVSMPSAVDTSQFSDKQLAEVAIPRWAEISDLEDSANYNLKEFSKSLNEQKQV